MTDRFVGRICTPSTEGTDESDAADFLDDAESMSRGVGGAPVSSLDVILLGTAVASTGTFTIAWASGRVITGVADTGADAGL